MDGRADLSQANFGALGDGGDVFHPQHRSVFGGDGGVLDVRHATEKTHDPDIDLLQSRFDETATGISVVIGQLLFHLPDAEAVGNQRVRIDPYLIFAGGAPEAGNIHDVGYGFELFFELPVFDGFELHQVVLGIGALQRVPVDLADGTPVGSHLRLQVVGK